MKQQEEVSRFGICEAFHQERAELDFFLFFCSLYRLSFVHVASPSGEGAQVDAQKAALSCTHAVLCGQFSFIPFPTCALEQI